MGHQTGHGNILSAVNHKLNVSGHMFILTFFIVSGCGNSKPKIYQHLSVALYIYCNLNKVKNIPDRSLSF
jgi:hypothetical protein